MPQFYGNKEDSSKKIEQIRDYKEKELSIREKIFGED